MDILSPEDLLIIEEEQALLEKVLAGLKEARKKTHLDFHGISEHLKDLREQAAAARAEDLPSLFDLLICSWKRRGRPAIYYWATRLF
ncbi:MAG: hypothetical protein NTV34_13190 [Proteobacteria bacterium]|nr:hypothetical protein [Pseudomonadota bacterium]